MRWLSIESTLKSTAATLAAAAMMLSALPGASFCESFEGENALIKRLSHEERLTYYGCQYIMNRYQSRHYLTRPSREDRNTWMERFWIDLDPTPSTERNERRIEHDKRVRLARKLFGMKKAPGWDKRGETMIRFGLPTTRTEVFGNVTFSGMTPPGEIWYYNSFEMLVSFQNYNLSGEFIYSIEPIGESSRRTLERIKNVAYLFKYNLIQSLYPTEYMELDDIKDIADFNPDEIDYVADPEIRLGMPNDLIAEIEQEKTEKYFNNFQKYMKEKPFVYSFELNQELMPLYFDVTAFDGGAGTLRAEVNLSVPTNEVRFISREGKLEGMVALRVLARDVQMNRAAAGEDVIRVSWPSGNAFTGPSHLPGQIVLTLKPGYYRLGIEAIDMTSGRRGVLKTNFELRPLEGSPSISDIQFASHISETEENTKFVKGNLQIVPHPLRAYKIPFPLSIYFEIYGLDTTPEDLAYYTVEYSIIPLQKRRKGPVLEEITSAISSRFETTGFGTRQIQRLSIATENLWQGTFLLKISVTDRRTMRIAEKSATFSILE